MRSTAVLMMMDAGTLAKSAPAPPPAPAAHEQVASIMATIADLADALAWPLVALTAVLMFKAPLTQFLSTIGGRLSKISAFDVDLELVAAVPTVDMPLIDRIRQSVAGALIEESSPEMNEQFNLTTPADYVLFSLGEGTEWLTSRLYLALLMMQRMRSVSTCVFVEAGPATKARFVALVPMEQLRWALAFRYPWLETAWVLSQGSLYSPGQAIRTLDPKTMSVDYSPLVTDTGRIGPSYRVDMLTRKFVRSLQDEVPNIGQVPAGANGASQRDGWTDLGVKAERADWVTAQLLRSLLPQDAFRAFVPEMRDAPRSQLTRAVLRRTGPFVALVDEDHTFLEVTNRRALLEEFAASYGEEPVT